MGVSFLFDYFNGRIFPTEAPTAMGLSSSNGCPKCRALKKSGKYSCCARGGAWFKNCGDADDTQFDHTWAEGIESCKRFSDSFLIKISQQAILRNVGASINPLSTNRPRNNTHQQRTRISRAGSMSNISNFADCRNAVGLYEIVVRVYVLFIGSQWWR